VEERRKQAREKKHSAPARRNAELCAGDGLREAGKCGAKSICEPEQILTYPPARQRRRIVSKTADDQDGKNPGRADLPGLSAGAAAGKTIALSLGANRVAPGLEQPLLNDRPRLWQVFLACCGSATARETERTY
jgi:hypothetical protein